MSVWYCVNTTPRSEMFLHKRLREKGYDTIHLWYPRTIRHARQETETCAPLFEQYLFVNVPDDRLRYVREQREVVGFVKSPNNERHEVHPHWIEFMRLLMVDDSGLVLPEIVEEFGLSGPKPMPDRKLFPQGLLLRIIGGPFVGMKPATVDVDLRDRIRVLVNILGRLTRVELDPVDVEPLHPQGGVSPSEPTKASRPSGRDAA